MCNYGLFSYILINFAFRFLYTLTLKILFKDVNTK